MICVASIFGLSRAICDGEADVKVALTFLLLIATSFAEPKTFDCGRIGVSSSPGRQSYYDVTHGFRFEFPADWTGSQVTLGDPNYNTIVINPLFAERDPKFYTSESGKVVGIRTVNGLEWTALSWPDGRRGYYSYRNGVAIEFVAMPWNRNRTGPMVSGNALGALDQIVSSFAFVDEPSRLDRQLKALKAGQKLGGLTVKSVLRGTGGFNGTTGTIEFTGRLVLTGTVTVESTPRSTSGYFVYDLDPASFAKVPQLSCPFREADNPYLIQIYFTNQSFAEQQFGKNDWYEGKATVVLDKFSEAFYNGGTGAWIRATLVQVRNLTTASQ